jgi:hypothetical protein
MAQPIYKGNCDNQVQPEGSVTVGDSLTRTVVIKGKKSTLQTLQNTTYLPNATYEGNWTVSSTTLTELPGYMAKLTLSLTIRGTSSSEFPNIPNPVSTIPVWEINWQSVEKPLTSNPKLVSQGSGTTQIAIDLVSAWKDSPQQRKRNYQVPLSTLTREAVAADDADWEVIPVNSEARKVCEKLAAGIEGYLLFSPVITKTEVYGLPPPSGACGTINTPVFHIEGYVYLKNGDRAVQNQDKTWTRTESWQGADSWDTDLYETT